MVLNVGGSVISREATVVTLASSYWSVVADKLYARTTSCRVADVVSSRYIGNASW